jgi:hypothetical protein
VLLELARQGRGDVAPYGGLLGDDEGLAHRGTP